MICLSNRASSNISSNVLWHFETQMCCTVCWHTSLCIEAFHSASYLSYSIRNMYFICRFEQYCAFREIFSLLCCISYRARECAENKCIVISCINIGMQSWIKPNIICFILWPKDRNIPAIIPPLLFWQQRNVNATK